MLEQGDALPDTKLMTMTADGPAPVQLGEYTRGKKVVIFGLPGAFTPTCSEQHLPGFVERAQELRDKGVDAIACLTTADFFVMKAWGEQRGVDGKLDMLSDGNHEFIRSTGMSIDLSDHGLGERSNRYAMIVDDGKVSWIGVEDNAGRAESSTAEAVLKRL